MEGDDFSPKKPKSSSSSISNISSSTGSQEGKICKVCGDQANSCNFGAITCDPCKAFFRRNGQKIKMLELCDENCVITKDTRASCKSCRLKKCMSVGMDKNLIWTMNGNDHLLAFSPDRPFKQINITGFVDDTLLSKMSTTGNFYITDFSTTEESTGNICASEEREKAKTGGEKTNEAL